MTTSLDLESPRVPADMGTGAVGLAAVMGAKASGAAEIVAIERVRQRLDPATDLGATHTIDTTVDRLVKNYPFAELNQTPSREPPSSRC